MRNLYDCTCLIFCCILGLTRDMGSVREELAEQKRLMAEMREKFNKMEETLKNIEENQLEEDRDLVAAPASALAAPAPARGRSYHRDAVAKRRSTTPAAQRNVA